MLLRQHITFFETETKTFLRYIYLPFILYSPRAAYLSTLVGFRQPLLLHLIPYRVPVFLSCSPPRVFRPSSFPLPFIAHVNLYVIIIFFP